MLNRTSRPGAQGKTGLGRLLISGAKSVVLAAALCAAAPSVFAQNVADSFTPFLNARDLRDLEYDGRGNLWAASNGGALRFETSTQKWTVFPRLLGEGPRGNDLVTVSIDASGNVWTGSASSGFTFYVPGLDIWDRDSEEWPDPRIRVIRSFGSGVYIGTQNGLSLKPTPTRTDICSDVDPGCLVPSFVVNDYALLGDTLWVATKTGLGRFNGATWDSAGALPPGSVGQESLSLAAFGGVLWEATPDSVRRLDGGTWSSRVLAVNRLVTTGGALHAVSRKSVYRFDGAGWSNVNVPLDAALDIHDIEIVSGNMYLATNDGLAFWDGGPTIAWRSVPPGPQLTGVFSGISVDSNGEIWAGTSEREIGILRYDGGTWGLTPAGGSGLNFQWILGLLSDSMDNLWVGHCCCPVPADCSAQILEGGQFTDIPDLQNARSMVQDARGNVWAATRGLGVQVLERPSAGEPWVSRFGLTTQNTGGSLASDQVTAVVPARDRTYIGLESDGLNIWSHGGDLNNGRGGGTTWTHVVQGLGLLDNNVRSMVPFGDNVWVGTSGGLHRYDGTSIQESCPTRKRLLAGDQTRKVNVLVADRSGGLWVGTDAGLMYLPRGGTCDASGGDFSIFTDQNSPLPDNRVVAGGLDPTDGSLWFGTSDGLLRVDPYVFTGTRRPSDRFVFTALPAFVLCPNPLYLSPGATTGLDVAYLGTQVGDIVVPVPTASVSTPEVFDITGQRVGAFSVENAAGSACVSGSAWSWRGKNEEDRTVAPGIYFVRTVTKEGATVVLKLAVIR